MSSGNADIISSLIWFQLHLNVIVWHETNFPFSGQPCWRLRIAFKPRRMVLNIHNVACTFFTVVTLCRNQRISY